MSAKKKANKLKEGPSALQHLKDVAANTECNTQLDERLMRLESSDRLQVRGLQPLSVGTGASLSAYSFEDFKATLTTAKEYTCNGNFAWIDPRSNTAPGVPILASSVATLSDANYVNVEDGVLKPFHAVIAVKDIELDPVTAGAPLFCVNPPEELHAVYKAIDDALPTMTPDDETKWRKWFQSCTMTCKVLDTETKREVATLKMRGEAAVRGAVLPYSTVQWILKILNMKWSREKSGVKVSNAELAADFDPKVFPYAPGQEVITETFIENCVYIWNHALCHAEIKAIFVSAAERYGIGNPFDSINKITQIIRKCKMDIDTAKNIFALMVDQLTEGYITAAELSNSFLFGNSTKKAFFDVLLTTCHVKLYLLHDFLPSLGLPVDVLRDMQQHLATPMSYRKVVPSKGSGLTPDLSWQAKWSMPTKHVWNWLANAIYGRTLEHHIKQNILNKQARNIHHTI